MQVEDDEPVSTPKKKTPSKPRASTGKAVTPATKKTETSKAKAKPVKEKEMDMKTEEPAKPKPKYVLPSPLLLSRYPRFLLHQGDLY